MYSRTVTGKPIDTTASPTHSRVVSMSLEGLKKMSIIVPKKEDTPGAGPFAGASVASGTHSPETKSPPTDTSEARPTAHTGVSSGTAISSVPALSHATSTSDVKSDHTSGGTSDVKSDHTSGGEETEDDEDDLVEEEPEPEHHDVPSPRRTSAIISPTRLSTAYASCFSLTLSLCL